MDDYEPCDKKATLYVMQQEIEGQTYNTSEWVRFATKKFHHAHLKRKLICLMHLIRRLFYFSRIPHSNLLLIIIGPTNQNYPKIVLGAEPRRINYTFLGDDTFPCHKKYLNKLERRRLDDCFTEDCRVRFFYCYVLINLLLDVLIAHRWYTWAMSCNRDRLQSASDCCNKCKHAIILGHFVSPKIVIDRNTRRTGFVRPRVQDIIIVTGFQHGL